MVIAVFAEVLSAAEVINGCILIRHNLCVKRKNYKPLTGKIANKISCFPSGLVIGGYYVVRRMPVVAGLVGYCGRVKKKMAAFTGCRWKLPGLGSRGERQRWVNGQCCQPGRK